MLINMRNFCSAALILWTGMAFAAEEETAKDLARFEAEVKKHKEEEAQLLQLSEAFGHFIGSNLYNPGINFNLESFLKGIRNGAAGFPAPLSDDKYNELMTLYQEKALIELSEENLKDATAFLNDNLDNVTVFEIEKGRLQYEIMKEGKGPIVTENASPLIHFKGQLLDGTVFASTESMGEPIEVALDQAIPGLQKGIAKMREGEKRRLYVHPDLGFGPIDDLPPNTVLIFEIQVLKANNPSEEISLPPLIEEDSDAYADEESPASPLIEEIEEEPSVTEEEEVQPEEQMNEELSDEIIEHDPEVSDEIESDPPPEEEETEEVSDATELQGETSDAEEIENQYDDDLMQHDTEPQVQDDVNNTISENQQEIDQEENDEVDFLNDDFELPQW